MRLHKLAAACVATAMSISLAACGGGADEKTAGFSLEEASEGSEVPSATVKLGMRPYPDNTFYAVGIREGYFEDVGITIDPAPNGMSTTEKQWTSLLVNKTVDINSATTTNLLPLFKSTDQPRFIAVATTYYGNVMLANPDLELTTLQDRIDAGDDFDTALKTTLTQLSGKEIYIQEGAPGRTFNEIPFEMADVEKPNFQTMDDSNMLLLAKSKKADFLQPSGASVAYQLLQDGWTPVFSVQQLLDNGPGGADSPLSKIVYNNGLASTADYVNENPETVLRFVSVMYRIIAELEEDPALYDVLAPYQNSVAGTDQSGAEIKASLDELNPLVNFEDASKYFVEEDSTEYYRTATEGQIQEMVDSGLAPDDLTTDDVMWAHSIYEELLSFKNQTDEILASLDEGSLSAAQQDVLKQAKQHYAWYNFLDAYRFARDLQG